MNRATPFFSCYWMGGGVLALGGATFARFLAPSIALPLRFYATAAGQFAALTGLFIIAVGVRQRLRRAGTRVSPPSSP
jgi:hypothetical protein